MNANQRRLKLNGSEQCEILQANAQIEYESQRGIRSWLPLTAATSSIVEIPEYPQSDEFAAESRFAYALHKICGCETNIPLHQYQHRSFAPFRIEAERRRGEESGMESNEQLHSFEFCQFHKVAKNILSENVVRDRLRTAI